VGNKDNIINKNLQNNSNLINTINTTNKLNNPNNINTTTNLITKEEDFSANKILSEIKSEISKGGKNLIRFTNCSIDYNYNKENTNDAKDKDDKGNNIVNIDDSIDDNIIKINNINNNNINNNNNNKKDNNKTKVPFISNISVTINQFFDRFKSSSKEENTSSERGKINNSEAINENEKKENIVEKRPGILF